MMMMVMDDSGDGHDGGHHHRISTIITIIVMIMIMGCCYYSCYDYDYDINFQCVTAGGPNRLEQYSGQFSPSGSIRSSSHDEDVSLGKQQQTKLVVSSQDSR